MTPEQEVSNRSILRVQQLSNELMLQLNSLPLFGDKQTPHPVKDVFFASRDHAHEVRQNRLKGGGPRHNESISTWYNFRLCGSYNFPDEHLNWLKLTFGDGQPNLFRLRGLFDAANKIDPTIRADFQSFQSLLATDTRRAVDQLLIALAVIPYNGVLIRLFERLFFKDKGETLLSKSCYIFSDTDERPKGRTTFCFTPFHQFRAAPTQAVTQTMGGMEFPPDLQECFPKAAKGQDIFDLFLLPFTRGEQPAAESSAKESPFAKRASNLHGLVIPGYDHYYPGKGWRGSMAGWVVVFLDHDCVNRLGQEKKPRNLEWAAFTALTETYIRRVREAHMRDLLEDYVALQDLPPPTTYLRNHIHQLIGWKASEQFGGLSSQGETDETSLIIPLDGGKAECVHVEELPGTVWQKFRSETKPRRRRFPRGTQRLCKRFLERLELAEQQRRVGEDSERETISHEIKHIVKSLKGEKWWLPPSEPIRALLDRFYSENNISLHASDARICPFPDIFKSMARVLELWSGTRDPVLIFDENHLPSCLAEVVRQIWRVVKDAIFSLAVFNDSITTSAGSLSLRSHQEALRKYWEIDDHLILSTMDESVPLPGRRYSRYEKDALNDVNDKTNWIVAIKILLLKFTDVFKHSDPRDLQIILSESAGCFGITITAKRRPKRPGDYEDQNLVGLTEALSRRAFLETEGEGQRIVRRLRDEYPEFLLVSEPENRPTSFRQTIAFRWRA